MGSKYSIKQKNRLPDTPAQTAINQQLNLPHSNKPHRKTPNKINAINLQHCTQTLKVKGERGRREIPGSRFEEENNLQASKLLQGPLD
jgi:hypothetical protein